MRIQPMRMVLLLLEFPKMIQQDTAPIVAYCEIFASSGEVHGCDVAQRSATRWPVSVSRE